VETVNHANLPDARNSWVRLLLSISIEARAANGNAVAKPELLTP
jgi:hypothetical protein